MENKNRIIEEVKSRVGWIYPDLKWLDKIQAEAANRNRERLLAALSDQARYSFYQNKLHIGKLSPGCSICGEGFWSCMYINGLCTANCFYCSQDRKMEKERPPRAEGIEFEDPKDYISYLGKFGFRGVGFSGGEGFLVLEKLLTYIKEIKSRFKDKIYIWMYTNGDLVTEDKLKRLKEAGLNEIRFDISARNYNLRAAKLAAGIINTVTVEIPCIPEDYEFMKGCLLKMKKAGVDRLNLHQLHASKNNYKNFSKRKYTLLHQHTIAVLESETLALKLIKYALEKKINLPINYCSTQYKIRLQAAGLRNRFAAFVKDRFEDVTQAGYIRRLGNRSIFYFEAQLCSDLNPGETGKKIKLPSGKNIFVVKKPALCWANISLSAKRVLNKLVSKEIGPTEVSKYIFDNFDLNKKNNLSNIQKETANLMEIGNLEFVENGFSEIY